PTAASIRAAAAITSITMKGGTSLRPDAVVNRPLARSLGVASSIDICYFEQWPQTSLNRRFVRAYRGSDPPPIDKDPFDADQLRLAPDNDENDGDRHGDRSCCWTSGGPRPGTGLADPARHRDRATSARLCEADPARGGPREAERAGHDHQPT